MKKRYREKRYICGRYLDGFIYPVYKTSKSRRGRYRATGEAQERLNQVNAERKLARLIHTNFTEQDLALHLTYDTNPESYKEANRFLQNFLRRVKYAVKKKGVGEFKYIAVTEKSSRGRFHHHLIVNAVLDRDSLEQIWKQGYANTKRLQFSEEGLTGLSKYITKAPAFAKRWSASQNLKQPQEKKRDGQVSRRAAEGIYKADDRAIQLEKLYPGYRLSFCEPFYSEVTGEYYLFFRMYKRTP